MSSSRVGLPGHGLKRATPCKYRASKVCMVEDDESKESPAAESAEEAPDNVLHVDFSRRRSREPEPVAEIVEYDDPLNTVKFECFAKLIELGMVMITLDSRFAGVDVPEKLRGIAELRLNFSHRFGIEDFAYDERGVRGSLSFDGVPYYCVIPWPAAFALYSHSDGKIFVFDPPLQ